MTQDFTPRNVVKFVAYSCVAHYTGATLHNAIIEITEIEEDNFPVELGCRVVGWGVAAQFKPATDSAVDKAADFINAKREARQAKKNAKKKDQK